VRAAPVSHRDFAGRLAEETMYRQHEGVKVLMVARQRRGPQNPIELRVGLAIVERQALAVLHPPVVTHLLLR
jgi:hypothetical protein